MASKEQVKIEYLLEDKASSGFLAMAGKIAGVAGGLTLLYKGIQASIEGFAEQEQAVASLNQALVNNNDYTDENTKALQAQASALQKTTAFADEDIIAAQAQLAIMGLNTDQIMQVTEATLDFAQAQGVDAASAATLIGKSIGTNTNALARYGVEITGAAGSTERLSAAVGGLSDKFGGQATAYALTFNGAMAQAKNAMGEVGETIGGVLAPYLARGAQAVTELAYKFQEFAQTESFAKFVIFTQNLMNGLIETLKTVWNWAVKIFDLFTQSADEKIAKFDEQIAKLEEKRQAIINNDEEMSARDEEKNAALLEKIALLEDQKNEILTTKQQEKDQIDSILAEQRAVKKATANAKELADEQRKQKALDDLEKERQKSFDTTLNYLATGMRSNNKTIFEIGKAAAVGDATIKAYQAFNTALASAPPPWNFVLAGATLAVGIDTVSRISSTQVALADGGIINPQNGGVTAQIAEANGAEAVIPLDSEGGMSALRQAASTSVSVSIDGRPLASHLYQVTQDMIRTGEIQS
jgi:hypothetical protein